MQADLTNLGGSTVEKTTASLYHDPSMTIFPGSIKLESVSHSLFLQEYAITSDDALILDNLPTDAPILIVGAGYISVEFSGIFNGMGAEVHLVYRKDLPLTG